MPKIEDYRIVRHLDFNLFVDNVKKAVSEGWSPVGSLFVQDGPITTYYYREFVKYAPEESPDD
jgi:hypothetical protein